MSASTIFVFFCISELLSYQPFTVRVLCTIGSAAMLSVVVHQFWGRLILRPINLLQDRMNSMGRGTWTQPIPVDRQDEIWVLVEEFNLLGPRLTHVAHQYAAASKLAAMALIGQRVTRRTNAARSRLAEIQELLLEARHRGQDVPPAALQKVGKAAEELADLESDLESEFQDELVRQDPPPQSMPREEGLSQRAAPAMRVNARLT